MMKSALAPLFSTLGSMGMKPSSVGRRWFRAKMLSEPPACSYKAQKTMENRMKIRAACNRFCTLFPVIMAAMSTPAVAVHTTFSTRLPRPSSSVSSTSNAPESSTMPADSESQRGFPSSPSGPVNLRMIQSRYARATGPITYMNRSV